MKIQGILKKSSMLLAICFVSALALSACKEKTEEHPKEHPATNQVPTNEVPTNQAPATP